MNAAMDLPGGVPDAAAWTEIWTASCVGRPPRPRRGTSTSVEPFPHRAVKDLALVTARFTAGKKQRDALAYNSAVERRIADRIGAKALIIVPDGDTGLQVRFLLRDCDVAA